MAIVFLSLGSNLGERELFLETAKTKLSEDVGKILNQSSLYETEPWGFTDENQFLNQVLQLETGLSPLFILQIIKRIETELGRVRGKDRYSSRFIDIDILFYDDLVITLPELLVPHPEIQNRRFVLEPLFELTEDFVHPVLKTSVKEMLKNCQDNGLVKKVQ
jgi:2-amino-4-hydroxy-6-hydroxymethyldihydropteridine diphosphokinase